MTFDYQRVYQHGTLALLVPGLFTGTLSVADLLTHGDFGIGTAHGLAGEMIILDGQAYQVTGEGQVNQLAPTDMVPFATVHFQAPELPNQTLGTVTKAELEARDLSTTAIEEPLLCR
ncbi:acetolactate decarboxylase [Latilactobacillus sakei]|uniref:acetolactate decarboxylase n=1 Tax=Latilactobacillus sakei TaxID=1599 RepID=UPI003079EF60